MLDTFINLAFFEVQIKILTGNEEEGIQQTSSPQASLCTWWKQQKVATSPPMTGQRPNGSQEARIYMDVCTDRLAEDIYISS